MSDKYRPIIGLEIHVELKTESKMFCQCPAGYFGKQPNTHTCPVCLGMPGALPVPNKKAIEYTILLGKALNCDINEIFKFDRKHYFYPDLPKGYQISQYDEPIAENGELTILVDGEEKSFRIKRVHLEEDTGKLTHAGEDTLVDYNRSGVPLVEIVTEPDFDNGEDVKAFLSELQVIVRYLQIANADMEKGDMRLEPNISLQLKEKYPELPNYKVEVKNINSFRYAKRAIEFEIDRHREILEQGETPVQETRGYDSDTGTTVSQRVKEEAADYRYFPEPDIPTFEYSKEELDEIYNDMPILPYEMLMKFIEEYGISEDDAYTITRDRAEAEKVMEIIESAKDKLDEDDKEVGQIVANYYVNKKINPKLEVDKFVAKLVEEEKPVEVDEDKLSNVMEQVISENQKAVDDYTSGSNPNAIMYLVGQVMKDMQGQADAQDVKSRLEKKLSG